MKKSSIIFLFAFSLLGINKVNAQSKIYHSAGGELIFSYGNVTANEEKIRSIPRFTAFLHYQSLWNYDPSDVIGFYSGITMRNVGIITEPNDSVKLKQRSYALGVPLAFKLGSMDKKFFIYAGGEAELMFHYKEKKFVNGEKVEKNREWFSDRTNMFNPSVFAGIQFPNKMNIKFKYYLNDFLNPAYVSKVGGVSTKPYAGVQSQMMYVSVGFNVYKRKK